MNIYGLNTLLQTIELRMGLVHNHVLYCEIIVVCQSNKSGVLVVLYALTESAFIERNT